jgi:dTDP-4-dehydrorhamnose 3,5-epimerase-like enzyme
MPLFEFYPIKNNDDARGDSFSIPQKAIEFVGQIDEIHFATILTNAVRGNHYHTEKKEATVITYSDKMRIAWKTQGSEAITQQDFEGKGAIVIQIHPTVVHAIQNLGIEPISIISFSNKRYNPQNPDTFREILLK